MDHSRQSLLTRLQGQLVEEELSPLELANIYTESALLNSSMEFIKEQLWLHNKNEQISFEDFLAPLFKLQLKNLSFLGICSDYVEFYYKNFKSI